MKNIIKFIQGLFRIIEWLFKKLEPPHPFSWETLILVSLFSFLMALVALILPEKTNVAHHTILACGFIFLMAGMLWWQIEWNPYKIGGIKIWPWVSAGLLCGFLFHYWPENWLYLTSIFWPIVSAAIAATPYFLNQELEPILPEPATRQRLVILLLSHLALVCWIQFSFTIQGWLQEYPSLLADSFSESYVVSRLNLQPRGNYRGQLILYSMESFLESKIQDKGWQNVELWMSGVSANQLEREVKLRMPKLEENEWWTLKTAIAQREIGYKLDLFAIWSGPTSNEQAYHLKKSCEITQAYPQLGTSDRDLQQAQARPVGDMACTRGSEPIFAEPESAFPWL